MREIIQKIIATESEAKLTVEAARAESDRILSEVQKKGHDLIEQARLETLIEADKIMEAAVKTAEVEKQRRLTDAAAEIESQIRLDPAGKERVIKEVIRIVRYLLCRSNG